MKLFLPACRGGIYPARGRNKLRPYISAPLLCSVCFGDPNSPLAKGAVAGVLFLGGVVTVVLAWIGITAWIWACRASRLPSSLDPPARFH